jgi:hypothetical protein
MSKKRVTIPLGEGKENLVFNALKGMRDILESLDFQSEKVAYAKYDLTGLMGIFSGDYKVMVEISQDDMDKFSTTHGVDFPEFVDMEIEEVVEEEVQEFEHLAYIEDNKLSLSVRSNKLFEGATNEDDTDMPFYRYETAEKGKHLFMEGTDYKAIYHNGGWLILNGYKVEEKVML